MALALQCLSPPQKQSTSSARQAATETPDPARKSPPSSFGRGRSTGKATSGDRPLMSLAAAASLSTANSFMPCSTWQNWTRGTMSTSSREADPPSPAKTVGRLCTSDRPTSESAAPARLRRSASKWLSLGMTPSAAASASLPASSRTTAVEAWRRYSGPSRIGCTTSRRSCEADCSAAATSGRGASNVARPFAASTTSPGRQPASSASPAGSRFCKTAPCAQVRGACMKPKGHAWILQHRLGPLRDARVRSMSPLATPSDTSSSIS
mmetsp:Transcript_45584/g.117082  ORF Transcript_45584/g.117082 Transcript_45584/m.117082 type:complete len:266 (-) Transcript_45584:290-1087(-)